MTTVLLDTHVAIWWLAGQRLTRRAAGVIADPATTVTFSLASVWEIAIKAGLGRLTVPDDYLDVLLDQGAALLSIDVAHTIAVRDLPLLHGDPFDRMLVAQAQVEGLTLVTRDERLRRYDVPSLEA